MSATDKAAHSSADQHLVENAGISFEADLIRSRKRKLLIYIYIYIVIYSYVLIDSCLERGNDYLIIVNGFIITQCAFILLMFAISANKQEVVLCRVIYVLEQ